jgi:uncharacterized protein
MQRQQYEMTGRICHPLPMKEAFRSERTRVRRLPKRGQYDLQTICTILDEGLVAHVGFAAEGQPLVVPMTYGREGERLFLHGSIASRLMRALGSETEVCVTVTLLDGLVLARSLFHHSMNYRSVMIFGRARLLEGEEKLHGLRVISDHTAPGRWTVARQPSDGELKATAVVEVPITEASAKIRSGGPADDAADMHLPVWAGEVRFRFAPDSLVAQEPVAAGAVPPDLHQFDRGGNRSAD